MTERTEREKMVAGEPYFPYDDELVAARKAARRLTRPYNATTEDEVEERERLLRALFGRVEGRVEVEPPFRCDYGFNISVGDGFYANFGCVVLDIAPVTFGRRVLLGPNVHVYAVNHPMDAAERATSIEQGKPVTVGDDVWIGGGSILCPGETVGDRSVIGAGSVVTKDIPPDVFAAGNPCRVIRPLK